MEYLMTYGWAILIVIIVAAALFALGVFNPATYTSRAATGFAGLGTPDDWQYSGTTFTVKLSNQVGEAVTVANVDATGCASNTSLTNMAAGATAEITLGTCTSKGVGDSYSQSVTVLYYAPGGYNRTATGTLTGTAI